MLKNINDVIDFATNQVAEELDIVQQERVVTGVASDANTKITMKTHNHYTDPTEQFLQVFGKAVLAQKQCITRRRKCALYWKAVFA